MDKSLGLCRKTAREGEFMASMAVLWRPPRGGSGCIGDGMDDEDLGVSLVIGVPLPHRRIPDRPATHLPAGPLPAPGRPPFQSRASGAPTTPIFNWFSSHRTAWPDRPPYGPRQPSTSALSGCQSTCTSAERDRSHALLSTRGLAPT